MMLKHRDCRREGQAAASCPARSQRRSCHRTEIAEVQSRHLGILLYDFDGSVRLCHINIEF